MTSPIDPRAPRPKILAYYFPNWHADERNAGWFGEGWTEWELVRSARPRFEGHRQPRVPALGHQDEAAPATFDVQIDLAVRSGVDGFIFDFYWYDDGGYLERPLSEGFLGSELNDRLDFAIMWANHDLLDIFPAGVDGPVRQLRRGEVTPEAFVAMTDHVIDRYFSRPNYLRVDGKPFFSVYEVGRLISSFGSVEAAAEALRDFERRTVAAGHPGLHLDCVLWGFGVLPQATTPEDPSVLVKELGFSSATSYVWIHHSDASESTFPRGDWKAVGESAFADYERSADTLDVPVYPNVTVGWDSTPRTDQSGTFSHSSYPWVPVWDGTPEEFAWGLEQAREFLKRHRPGNPIVTVNAWNEWTEGSALLPDTHHGMAFLNRITEVFGHSDTRGRRPRAELGEGVSLRLPPRCNSQSDCDGGLIGR